MSLLRAESRSSERGRYQPDLRTARHWAFSKPAGASGADFVVLKACFGNPLNYGGPYLGIFAAREKFDRRILADWSARPWIKKAGADLC